MKKPEAMNEKGEQQMSKEIELGMMVQDCITGFKGRVTGKAEYITGCTQYLLNPKCSAETGAMVDSGWFDEGRLRVVEDAEPLVLPRQESEVAPGGPQSHPAPRK